MLPAYIPTKTWEPAPKGYKPVQYGSAFPSIVKHPDGRLIIDQSIGHPTGLRRLAHRLALHLRLHNWATSLIPVEVAVFDNTDHPNFAKLPPNAPRAVKQLYRREWQLKYLRSTDAWPIISDMNNADEAWSKFTDGTTR